MGQKKGYKLTEEHKQKIRLALRGRKLSNEHKKKVSDALKGIQKFGKDNPFYGKKHTKESRRKISESLKGKPLSGETKKRLSKRFKGEKNPFYGKTHSDDVKKLISKTTKRRLVEKPEENPFNNLDFSGDKNGNWKGGYHSNNIPTYDGYAHNLQPVEEVRRVKRDPNILEVKCAYCGRWYQPSLGAVGNRVATIRSSCERGEAKLYCSNKCKKECPVYGRSKYPKGYKKASAVEVDPNLRQLVFKRDNWECQKCGKSQDILQTGLHCHHIDPATKNPMFANDMDSCVTVCKECHKVIHQQPGCGYYELRCKERDYNEAS